MCRHPISFASLLSLPADSSEYVQPDDHATVIKSAKITELVKFLKAFDGDDKTLVFSQFTSFLDHVAANLRGEGIVFSRFDGSMSAKAVSGERRSAHQWTMRTTDVIAAPGRHPGIPGASDSRQRRIQPQGHAYFAQIGSRGPQPYRGVKCLPGECNVLYFG
jgi:SWI/SNF-related matrix-associated actin-dependent regulator of chromatin subfamily A3